VIKATRQELTGKVKEMRIELASLQAHLEAANALQVWYYIRLHLQRDNVLVLAVLCYCIVQLLTSQVECAAAYYNTGRRALHVSCSVHVYNAVCSIAGYSVILSCLTTVQ
jgi:hypothetical protein